MQNKEFTSREKGMIKNTAKAVYPLYEKLLKLEAQSQKLQLEIETQRNLINKWEAGVMDLTGGYKSTELVKKEMITVGEGEKAIRKANYTFYYGDTVIPVEDITPENITPEYVNQESFNPEVIASNPVNPIN